MNDLIKFFDKVKHSYAMHLEIYYSKICDWVINIYKAGCGENGEDLIIFYKHHCDIDYLAAKAQVALKEHLLEVNDGY